MKISVITPTLNYGRFLPDAIESVDAQDGVDVEHLVIDGGSTDTTLGVLERYAHLPHLDWVSEPDKGQSDAINKGFRRATGDILCWLNADEFYMPGALRAVAAAFAAEPEHSVVYGLPLFVNADGAPMRVLRHHRFDWSVLLYYGCYITSVAAFFRRGPLLERDDPLDTSYRVAMDLELYLRLASRGVTFGFVPALLGAFRCHAANVSAVMTERRLAERLRAQRTYGPSWTRRPLLGPRLIQWAAWVFRLRRQCLKLPLFLHPPVIPDYPQRHPASPAGKTA